MSKKKTFNEFISEFETKFGKNKYDFDESTFVNSHTPMRCFCHVKDKNGNEHGEFWKTPKALMSNECRKCSYEKRAKNYTMTTEKFIEKAKSVHGDKYDYSKSVYVGTKQPIEIICKKHGSFFQTPNDHLSKKGCPKCNEPHLEKILEKALIDSGINFISQYRTEYLGKQSLDFYIPDKKIGIECQGKQHFGYGGWSKKYDFQRIKELDERKLNLCREHGIEIIYFAEELFAKKILLDITYKDRIITKLNDLLKLLK